MVATAAALVCCSIAIVTAIVSLATGGHFEQSPAETALRQYRNELEYDFEKLGALDAPAADAVEAARPVGAVPPGTTGESGSSCSEGSWPFFSNDCLWTTESSPRHRRPAQRLKTSWCAGLLRHLPLCLTRPR